MTFMSKEQLNFEINELRSKQQGSRPGQPMTLMQTKQVIESVTSSLA